LRHRLGLLVADYNRIRDKIEEVFPDVFAEFNKRVREPGGLAAKLLGERTLAEEVPVAFSYDGVAN
jgi:hypothetical protein